MTGPCASGHLPSMANWLVKQEPEDYSFDTFRKDKKTIWDGVRNFQARNNLRAMREGDYVFYYHSGKAKEIVGAATVTKEAFPDPTAEEGDWSVVELKAGKSFPNRVPLAVIKGDKRLKDIALVRQSRLSVMPITQKERDVIHKLAGME